MLRIAGDVCRRLWLISIFLLAAAHVAAAGSLAISADFDGDGQDDRAEFDRREPHALRVRLSGVHVTFVFRNETPFVGLAARHLDHDARAELIASDGSSRLQIFTHHAGGRGGLQPFEPRPRGRAGFSRPIANRADGSFDDDASSNEDGASTHFALPRRAPQTARPLRLATRPLNDRARSPWACLCASFSPRPPPVRPSSSLLACDG